MPCVNACHISIFYRLEFQACPDLKGIKPLFASRRDGRSGRELQVVVTKGALIVLGMREVLPPSYQRKQRFHRRANYPRKQ